MTFRDLLVFVFLLPCFLLPLHAQEDGALQREEAEEYFQNWLNEDVFYIITSEERAVFENLTTVDEKEQFVEQFWFRRDPDPRTADNEFRAEHYRRIAYANEKFGSGLPGWQTDRGRIYIIHGPPTEIESHPTGGIYERPMSEGGGSTNTFPFEVWRYRYIEGVGDDVRLEFVDTTMAGEYRLSYRPEDKDALLHVPGAGLTMAETYGLAGKADRPYFSVGGMDSYPMMHYSARDSFFARYETYARVQRPAEIKYPDLKELVTVNVDYADLPFSIREDYFRLNDKQVLAPVTVQTENKQLKFRQEGDRNVARLAVYGIVTSIGNRVVYEFEDDVLVSHGLQDLEAALSQKSIYQRIIPLDDKMRYKLDLIVQDLHSGQTGVVRRPLIPPSFQTEKIAASSLVLSDSVRIIDTIPEEVEKFVLGDVKIYPSLANEFTSDRPLGVYFQLYNVQIDQSTLLPSLVVTISVFKDGELLGQLSAAQGEWVQFYSGQRIVILKLIGLEGMEPGEYQIKVEVQDRLNEQQLELNDRFTIVTREQIVTAR
jgi:GWxTD domain-containing protein